MMRFFLARKRSVLELVRAHQIANLRERHSSSRHLQPRLVSPNLVCGSFDGSESVGGVDMKGEQLRDVAPRG
jgi:hypothetical protein